MDTRFDYLTLEDLANDNAANLLPQIPKRKRPTIKERLAEVNGVVTPSKLDSEALRLRNRKDDCERREFMRGPANGGL